MKLLMLFALLCSTCCCHGYRVYRFSESNLNYNQSAIIGGSNTTITRHPSMAYLLLTYKSANPANCGGTILSDRHILTAAHCIIYKSPRLIIITIGTTYIPNNTAKQYHSLTGFFHNKYQLHKPNYDIGVIKTKEKMELSSIAQPTRLASAFKKVAKGDKLTVVGYGRYEDFLNNPNKYLKSVGIEVVDLPTCQSIYANMNTAVTDVSFCAGGEKDKGTCDGDSGGPAINKDNVQVGLVSGGYICGQNGYPTVFSDVGFFHGWIDSVMAH